MVTDQYSHILDENRRTNAQLIEKAFYNGHGAEPPAIDPRTQNATLEQFVSAGVNPAELAKILGNPDMVKMLEMLAKSMGK